MVRTNKNQNRSDKSNFDVDIYKSLMMYTNIDHSFTIKSGTVRDSISEYPT